MARYKVKNSTDDSVTISCGCRGRKDVTVTREHMARMVEENHDLLKAADTVGVSPRHNRVAVMNAVMDHGLAEGWVDRKPKGWE